MLNTKKKSPFLNIPTLTIIALMVILIPMTNGNYSQMIFNLAIIQAITALGISVMLGMGGLLSYASVSFMGIGAFVMANLTSGRNGFIMSSLPSLLISVLVSGVLGLVIGIVLLRLKGTYFTFATIGFVQVMYSIFINFRPLSNGPDGISGIPTLSFFGWTITGGKQWFYFLVAVLIIVALLVERIRNTQLGRSLASIRDNEVAAQTLGVNIYATKVIAFVLAALLSGLSGALYCVYNAFVSSELFTFSVATTYIIMVMLGGANNTKGVILGALLVSMLPEWLRPMEGYLRLIYGVGVIVLMVFMPSGLAGVVQSLKNKFVSTFKKKEAYNETNTVS